MTMGGAGEAPCDGPSPAPTAHGVDTEAAGPAPSIAARRSLSVAAVVAALSLIALSVRWWATPSWRLPMIQALYPVLAAGLSLVLVVGALVLLRRRRRGPAALVALPLLVPAALAAGTLSSDTVAAGARDEVVLAANLQYGQADPQAIVSSVRTRGVSSLVLVEVTPSAWAGLRRAGLDTVLPHQVGAPRTGAGGSMVLSRHPLRTVAVPGAAPGFAQPAARVSAPGGAYVMRAVHTYPPTGGLGHRWADQLAELARWQRSVPSGEPLVLAGDFNASASHPGFRQVRDGMTDALAATGAGWVRTWPREERIPPFVGIDHVLTRGMPVVDAGTVRLPGSDHDGVWARLRR